MSLGRGARLGLIVTTTVLGLASGEIVLRWLGGYRVTSLALRRRSPVVASADAGMPVADAYVARGPVAPGIDRRWFALEPPRRAGVPLDADLVRRSQAYPSDSITPFFSFNRRYLQQEVCGPSHGAGLPPLQEFFYFEPTDPVPYPRYRHLRHVAPPGWFVTNNFGWRGPDVTVQRGAGVIRIAFVGASTTIDNYGVPFSHPELVEYWLNRWASAGGRAVAFEVINAGRSGIESQSIAAVVRQEIAPVDPDLVIFYEGANQFWPGQTMTYRFGRFFPRPKATFRRRLAAESYLVTVNRLLNVVDRFSGGDGREPLKPPYSVTWPEGLDPKDPDLGAPVLPMDLKQVLADLGRMRDAVAADGGALAVSSFVWLVHDGLQLDLARQLGIYRYLNDTYWPIAYTQMRRMADFQNLVFEKFARANHLAFLDIASTFPQDPNLFDDGIHMNYSGLRLQAWLFVQSLVPIITAHLASGAWPRPIKEPARLRHPAFEQPDRRLVTLADLKASCP